MTGTTPIETNLEGEMDVLWARIEEKMTQIKRDREAGEEIVRDSQRIRVENARMLADLDAALARLK